MDGGVVLVGGRSTRMGVAKAGLTRGTETFLEYLVRVLRDAVPGPVVVVRAPGQELAAIPDGAEVAQDPVAGRGPLQGIATGLAALDGRAEAAFVCAVDLPLLIPEFVRAVLGARADHDVALPHARGFRQPLAAAYRVSLAPLITDLLDADLRRPGFLFERCRVLELDDAALLADPALAAVDPNLDSLRNVNTREDYAALDV